MFPLNFFNKKNKDDDIKWLLDIDTKECIIVNFDKEQYITDKENNKKNEIIELNKEIIQIKEMYEDINRMINVQEDKLNDSELKLKSATINVDTSEIELDKASMYKKKGILLTTGIFSICLGCPLSLIYGIKIGAGVFIASNTGGYFISKLY